MQEWIKNIEIESTLSEYETAMSIFFSFAFIPIELKRIPWNCDLTNNWDVVLHGVYFIIFLCDSDEWELAEETIWIVKVIYSHPAIYLDSILWILNTTFI